MSVWYLPVIIVGTTVVFSIPVGLYLAWVVDGRYRAPRWLRWLERSVDTGAQSWKQYAVAILLFSIVMFLFSFVVLALQPQHPAALNPAGHGRLAPATIFNTAETEAMATETGKPLPQVIARGPVAAVLPIKHLGTNGGGFFGANSAHPYENPNAWTNYLECVTIMIFPFALVIMFGRMLNH